MSDSSNAWAILKRLQGLWLERRRAEEQRQQRALFSLAKRWLADRAKRRHEYAKWFLLGGADYRRDSPIHWPSWLAFRQARSALQLAARARTLGAHAAADRDGTGVETEFAEIASLPGMPSVERWYSVESVDDAVRQLLGASADLDLLRLEPLRELDRRIDAVPSGYQLLSVLLRVFADAASGRLERQQDEPSGEQALVARMATELAKGPTKKAEGFGSEHGRSLERLSQRLRAVLAFFTRPLAAVGKWLLTTGHRAREDWPSSPAGAGIWSLIDLVHAAHGGSSLCTCAHKSPRERVELCSLARDMVAEFVKEATTGIEEEEASVVADLIQSDAEPFADLVTISQRIQHQCEWRVLLQTVFIQRVSALFPDIDVRVIFERDALEGCLGICCSPLGPQFGNGTLEEIVECPRAGPMVYVPLIKKPSYLHEGIDGNRWLSGYSGRLVVFRGWQDITSKSERAQLLAKLVRIAASVAATLYHFPGYRC